MESLPGDVRSRRPLRRGARSNGRSTQELREAGDDDARAVSQEEAAGVLAHAEEFVQAVERLLSG
jgi:hypothetical protein